MNRIILFTALALSSLGPPAIVGAQRGFKLTPILKGATTIKEQQIEYPDTDRPEITSAIGEVAPGGESGRHRHPVPTIVHVLEGTSTIDFDDGSRFEAPAGTAFLEAVGTWHNVRAFEEAAGTRGTTVG